jgi:hypothetical protein
MVGFAADVWEKWKPQYGPQPKWVAEQINKHLHIAEVRKTGRWVTTHQKDIVEEAERRKNAKG